MDICETEGVIMKIKDYYKLSVVYLGSSIATGAEYKNEVLT